MKVPAPASLESSSEMSTLSIGSLPLPDRPSANEHPHMPEHYVPESQRASLQGENDADSTSNSSDRHLDSPGPSRPRSSPQATVRCAIQELSPNHEQSTRSPPKNAVPSIPEAGRVSSPPFEIPTRNAPSPAQEEISVRGPSPSTIALPSNHTEWHPNTHAPPLPQTSPAPARANGIPPVRQPSVRQDAKVKHLHPQELMTGEQPKPIYGAFTSPNCPQRYKPPLKKTAPLILLPDCWRCPEAELSKRLQRFRFVTEPVCPIYPRQLDVRTTEPSVRDEGDKRYSHQPPDVSSEGMGQVLLMPATASLDASAVGIPQVADERESEPERESGTTDKARPSRVKCFFKCVASPFVRSYSYVAGGITAYIHDRDARSGQLGSHDTETAQILRCPTFE